MIRIWHGLAMRLALIVLALIWKEWVKSIVRMPRKHGFLIIKCMNWRLSVIN